MAAFHDPLEKDQDGHSNAPTLVQEINADFRRDLAFQALTDEMVQRVHSYGREEWTAPKSSNAPKWSRAASYWISRRTSANFRKS